jgi:hypothetical protein
LWKRKLIFILILVTTVGLVLCVHLLKPPLDDHCSGVGYLSSNRTTTVHAIKVVVEPFLGQHQVYGIFQLSLEDCPPGQPVILTVVGAGKYCEIVNNLGQHFEGIEVGSKYYLTKHYIRTRTAISLSIKGLLSELKQPRNWTMTYAK